MFGGDFCFCEFPGFFLTNFKCCPTAWDSLAWKSVHNRYSSILRVLEILLSVGIPWHVDSPSYRATVPNFFGTRDRFHGRQFFHGRGSGGGMVQAVMQAMGSGR